MPHQKQLCKSSLTALLSSFRFVDIAGTKKICQPNNNSLFHSMAWKALTFCHVQCILSLDVKTEPCLIHGYLHCCPSLNFYNSTYLKMHFYDLNTDFCSGRCYKIDNAFFDKRLLLTLKDNVGATKIVSEHRLQTRMSNWIDYDLFVPRAILSDWINLQYWLQIMQH